MNEIEKIPTAKNLSKMGVSAVGYCAAGAFLLILSTISNLTIPGIIAGAIVLLFGITNLASKDPADKRAGMVITAAGALTVLSVTKIPLLAPVSGVLLTVGAIGLLGLGILNAVKFFRGLKKRS